MFIECNATIKNEDERQRFTNDLKRAGFSPVEEGDKVSVTYEGDKVSAKLYLVDMFGQQPYHGLYAHQ